MAFAANNQRERSQGSSMASLSNTKVPLTAKRSHLLKIMERENHEWRYTIVKAYVMKDMMGEVHERLKSSPTARRLMDEAINQMVDDPRFVIQGKYLITKSKNLLKEIEQRLKQQLAELPLSPQNASTSQSNKNSSVSGQDPSSSPPPPSGMEGSITGGTTATTITKRLRRKDPALQALEKEREDKLVKTQRAITYRNELDKQANELQERLKHKQVERLADLERARKSQETFLSDEAEKQARRKKLLDDNRAFQVEMIQRNEKQRQAEKQAKLAAERLLNEHSRQLIQEEEALARQQKAHEKARQKWIEEEYKVEQERRKQVALEVMKEDIRLRQEYTKKLDKEEQERKDAFSKRTAKLTLLGQFWQNQSAEKAEAEAIKRLELSIQEAALRKEQELREKEQRKKEEQFASRRLVAEENRKAKQEERGSTKEKVRQELDLLQREMAAMRASEFDAKQTQREKKRQYLLALQKQMMEDEKKHQDQVGKARLEGIE